MLTKIRFISSHKCYFETKIKKITTQVSHKHNVTNPNISSNFIYHSYTHSKNFIGHQIVQQNTNAWSNYYYFFLLKEIMHQKCKGKKTKSRNSLPNVAAKTKQRCSFYLKIAKTYWNGVILRIIYHVQQILFPFSNIQNMAQNTITYKTINQIKSNQIISNRTIEAIERTNQCQILSKHTIQPSLRQTKTKTGKKPNARILQTYLRTWTVKKKHVPSHTYYQIYKARYTYKQNYIDQTRTTGLWQQQRNAPTQPTEQACSTVRLRLQNHTQKLDFNRWNNTQNMKIGINMNERMTCKHLMRWVVSGSELEDQVVQRLRTVELMSTDQQNSLLFSKDRYDSGLWIDSQLVRDSSALTS
eukprot:TRINITY_DN1790_c0_g1_i5.p1 TRINITY_DN1790_c0_g1~~TRINITY_DN1790_c0_g1_i5.p1  ORF type:complete len:357 (+),score=-18.60 TRINITY_DN1790_c0_g1_i5:1909-2979(+)